MRLPSGIRSRRVFSSVADVADVIRPVPRTVVSELFFSVRSGPFQERRHSFTVRIKTFSHIASRRNRRTIVAVFEVKKEIPVWILCGR